ncbi:MAG: uracil-xanthine permease family protein [Tissierellia bacterium]|nr:uracil-xanthine permease family protein [Tissierellia bacterium]
MTEHVLKDVKETKTINSLKRSILGLQHLIAMFGATVLVPILTGLSPSVALLSAGVGTIIFHFVTDKKVPVFLGSSFAFIPVILKVKEMYNQDLAYAQGGILIAGLIYVLLSFVIDKIGTENINKYLPAQVIGPMIIVIGLNLIPTAIGMASDNLPIALLTLATCLIVQNFTRGFIRQLSILIAVVVGYLASLSLNLVDTSIISTASLFSVPDFSLPKFSLPAIITIAPIILAVFMEHLGDVKTNGQVVGKDFLKDPGLNKTLLGDGLATVFAAMIGGPANTTYGENTAVLAVTKNYDSSLLRLAAIYAIVLSFIGKLGGVLHSIPVFVMGGISIVLFSMIALVGVKTIRTNKVKLNIPNIIIMGSIIILGLFSGQIEKFTGVMPGIRITDSISISGLSFAAIVGIILNIVFSLIGNKEK